MRRFSTFVFLLWVLSGCQSGAISGGNPQDAGNDGFEDGNPAVGDPGILDGDTGPAKPDPDLSDCPPPVQGFEGEFTSIAKWVYIGKAKTADGDIDGPVAEVSESYPLGAQAATQLPGGGLVLLHGASPVDLRFSIICGGRMQALAGNGMPGMRDGPAAEAMFSFERPNHYNLQFNLDSDEQGTVYFTDLGNARIRTLSRNPEGQWFMKTVAGGGTTELNVGQSAVATDVNLTMYMGPHLAMASDQLIWIIGTYELYKFTPGDGMLQRFPMALDPVESKVYSTTGDHRGNAYIVSESGAAPCRFWHLAQDGTISLLAGSLDTTDPYAGAPESTFFWTVPGIAVLHGGAYLYANGGDSPVVRRIPVAGGDVEALLPGGIWGPAESKSDGLQKAHALLGADRQGGILSISFGRFWPGEQL